MTPIYIPSRETFISLLKTSSISEDQLSAILMKLTLYEVELWNEAVEHAAKTCDVSANHTYEAHVGRVSVDLAKRIRALKAYQTTIMPDVLQ